MNNVDKLLRETSVRHSRTYWLAVATFINVVIVNTLGFTDTITGSAMGCGRDWPLCNGQLIPTIWNQATFIEYIHRISVLVAGPLLIVLAVVALRKYGQSRKVRGLLAVSLLGVVVEGVLGALAVMFVNPPAVMAAHLGFALLTFAGVLLLTIVIGQIDRAGGDITKASWHRVQANRNFARAAWWSLPYAYAAIYLGAYVASTGDGAMFQGWPLPTESYAQIGFAFWIDVAHRSAALAYFAWMVWLVVLARRERWARPDLYRGSWAALILVCTQAFSGGLLVLTHVSVYAFLIHVTVVSLLFSSQCYLAMQLLPARAALNNREEEAPRSRQRAGA